MQLLECRGKIETNITAVARGQRSKEDVLQEAATWFKEAFLSAQSKAGESAGFTGSVCSIDEPSVAQQVSGHFRPGHGLDSFPPTLPLYSASLMSTTSRQLAMGAVESFTCRHFFHPCAVLMSIMFGALV